MSGDFLDANIILYSFDVDDRKREVSQQVVAQALVSDACISFQVVQEVLNVLTRRARQPASQADAYQVLTNILVPLWRVMPSEVLYLRALELYARYQYGFYDSLIIAAALASGCTRLYSEDLQAGQRIEGLTVVDPFL
jgi:predicted nucleic acid-binding protein